MNRRAVTNIIATMLIFALMIVSMGVLYQIIAPTVLGFNAKSRSANQEFILLTLANEFEELVSSPEGSQARISIVSDGGIYSVSTGYELAARINGAGGLIDPAATVTTDIGEFRSDVNGTFQYEKNEHYLTRIVDENSLIQDNDPSINTNLVSKVQYDSTNAIFRFYSRSRIDIVETAANVFEVSIVIPKITFSTISSVPIDFPVNIDEFTLRLRRQASTITTGSVTGVLGPFNIDHDIDGVLSSEVYTFGSGVLTDINFKFIEVPILFSI